MSLTGHKLDLMRQRLFIPVQSFSGYGVATAAAPTITITKGAIDGGDTEPGLSADADAAALVNNAIGATRTGITGVQAPAVTMGSFHTGAPVLGEIGSTGLSGMIMTAGDMVCHLMAIPSIWNRSQKIRVRTVYSTESATAADEHLWIVLYAALALNTDAIATPATALDTAIVADIESGTAKHLQACPWGIINGGGLDDADEFVSWLIELQSTDAGEAIHLLGAEFEYTPKLSRDQGHNLKAEGPAWEA